MARARIAKKAVEEKLKSKRQFVKAAAERAAAGVQSKSPKTANQRLRRRVADLERKLERCQTKLREAVAQGTGTERLLARQFVATELHHGDLASLYVASMRLQSTLRRQDVLGAIREIVLNLIGVEEMALFENDPRTATLSLIDCYGDAWTSRLGLQPLDDVIRRVALTGKHYFRDVNGGGEEPADEGTPAACIPLKVDGDVRGMIVIWRLLPQKDRLVALDYQLFDLLSTQAGIALYCAQLSAERRAATEITT